MPLLTLKVNTAQAPPGVSKSLAAGYVSAGSYTDITSISAPDEALPGSKVIITVRIKNTYSAAIGIMAGGALEYGVSPWPGITFPDDIVNVGAGKTSSFVGYFYMPDYNVTIHAYSYFYGADGYWYFDDEATEKVPIGGWELIDSAQVTIGVVLKGWLLLDTDYATVGTYLPGWQVLDTESVTVGLEVSKWQQLHTKTVTVALEPVTTGWELLNEQTAGITAGSPEEVWELLSHKLYDLAETYVGQAEVCTFEFSLTPEQIPGTEWFGKAIAEAFADEVINEGSEMLELEVYENTSPALWTNFRVVATATVPETKGVANPLPWAIIIAAVLAILFIVSLTFLIKEIKTIDWSNPVEAIPTALLIGGVVVVAAVSIAAAVGKQAPERSLARTLK